MRSITRKVYFSESKDIIYNKICSFFKTRKGNSGGRSPHFRRGEAKFIRKILETEENEWIKIRYREAGGRRYYSHPIDSIITINLDQIEKNIAVTITMQSVNDDLLSDKDEKYWITLLEDLLRYVDNDTTLDKIIELYGIQNYNELVHEDDLLENKLKNIMKVVAGFICMILILYLVSFIK